MSEIKHTPGPWKVCHKDDIDFKCMSVIVPESSSMTVGNNGRLMDDKNKSDVIAIVLHQMYPLVGDDIDVDEAKANGCLISAAPEMLEALERARRFIINGVKFGYIYLPNKELNDSANETLPWIEKAISKAKGKSEEMAQ